MCSPTPPALALRMPWGSCLSGRGDARVAPPCPPPLCVWRSSPYPLGRGGASRRPLGARRDGARLAAGPRQGHRGAPRRRTGARPRGGGARRDDTPPFLPHTPHTLSPPLSAAGARHPRAGVGRGVSCRRGGGERRPRGAARGARTRAGGRRGTHTHHTTHAHHTHTTRTPHAHTHTHSPALTHARRALHFTANAVISKRECARPYGHTAGPHAGARRARRGAAPRRLARRGCLLGSRGRGRRAARTAAAAAAAAAGGRACRRVGRGCGGGGAGCVWEEGARAGAETGLCSPTRTGPCTSKNAVELCPGRVCAVVSLWSLESRGSPSLAPHHRVWDCGEAPLT